MFVADNAKLLVAVQRAFHKPVFMGFKPLEIDFDDCCLVKLLPERLQPKFLSEACKETLDQEGMLEEATPLLGEIHELLQSQEFKTGVLRLLHHYKLQGGSGLVKKEKDEVVALLARVTVRQVSTIRTTLTLHDTVVGQQEKNHFVAVNGKPHYIHSTLEERGIKEYSTDVPERSLFMCDVGTYLEEQFLPLLDNSFSEFYKNEIVCMKKYLCENKGADVDDEDAEEDIFVIVEVVKLEEKHPNCHMQNTYQVITSRSPPCLVTVRAHQLYRFVRKDDDASQSKFESREDIFRKLREELRRIWQVEDEQERRHLLRRLKFKWHPDKNPEQVELCTQVMQYMMSLVGRLENGEAIPEEEDPTNPPQATPSRAYSQCFRPPRRCYRNRNRAAPRQPRPDLPEARRWLRQARSDLEAAEAVKEQVPWWTVFMCYQAAEKVLLAALFVQDRELASEKEGEGPLVRTLSGLALLLNSPHAVQLANTIEQRAGGFLEPLYPTFGGCPQDRYTLWDTNQVLPPCRELLQGVSQHSSGI
ncbi:hypothetical protein O3P69_012228 [Scylla paramamosain]|uniref:HEPN domain-containing protein n=1 Tax=Scylla paramamosain TaxID=85552 RepID=A0AAW0TCL4_SCYPA